MALSITLGTLVTRCLQRSDKVSDPQVDAPEVKSLISELYGELHALVTEKGARYFETEATITANGSAGGYALPANHLSTVGVDYQVDAAGRRQQLRRLTATRRYQLAGLTGQAYRYALEAANIVLYPNPASGTYRHLYVPQPTDYASSSDGTSVDVINIYGQKFIVWGVASILLHKGESNQIRAVDERDRARAELEYWATLRALHDPNPRLADDDEEDDLIDAGDWRFR